MLTQIYMYLLNSEKAQGSKTLKLFKLDKYRVKMKVHLILNINRFSPAIFMMLHSRHESDIQLTVLYGLFFTSLD